MDFTISAFDDSMGVLIGWGIVSYEKGKRYFDLDGEHFTEDAIEHAVVDFMASEERHAGIMHMKKSDGSLLVAGKVISLFPLTREFAKALDIDTNGKFGAVAIVRPEPWIVAAYEQGLISGFSFGGSASDEFIEEVA